MVIDAFHHQVKVEAVCFQMFLDVPVQRRFSQGRMIADLFPGGGGYPFQGRERMMAQFGKMAGGIHARGLGFILFRRRGWGDLPAMEHLQQQPFTPDPFLQQRGNGSVRIVSLGQQPGELRRRGG